MTTEFEFDRRKVQFMFDVMPNSEKQRYKMESEFEEIESVRLVAVGGGSTRALLLQVRIIINLLALMSTLHFLCVSIFNVEDYLNLVLAQSLIVLLLL